MSLFPTPAKRTYSACKYFDHTFTTAIGYEMASVDVVSVLPGLVATALSGIKEVNPLKGVISAGKCATGILNNASTGFTYGGFLHEVLGLFMKIIIDIIPARPLIGFVGAKAAQFEQKQR